MPGCFFLLYKMKTPEALLWSLQQHLAIQRLLGTAADLIDHSHSRKSHNASLSRNNPKNVSSSNLRESPHSIDSTVREARYWCRGLEPFGIQHIWTPDQPWMPQVSHSLKLTLVFLIWHTGCDSMHKVSTYHAQGPQFDPQHSIH